MATHANLQTFSGTAAGLTGILLTIIHVVITSAPCEGYAMLKLYDIHFNLYLVFQSQVTEGKRSTKLLALVEINSL